jgi:SAM-dependent methyltransferase
MQEKYAPAPMVFEELKQRHAVVWGSGPYQGITETITDIHRAVIGRLQPQPGQRLLDLACGTGAVAELAATTGAEVIGVDIAPALIGQAKARAGERGLEIDYRVGDAEALELEDASVDLAASICGVMFAPDHEAVARELARVTKPGGRIALACWTPDSGLARMFQVMRPFQPSPPPGVGNQFDWGREDYVSGLLGGNFELASSTAIPCSRRRRARRSGSSSQPSTDRRRRSPTHWTTSSGSSFARSSSSCTKGPK